MHPEPGTADNHKLELPPDLVRALNSPAHKPKTDYGIEALKPSLLGRLMERLIGPKN